MKTKSKKVAFKNIRIGAKVSFGRVISKKDVEDFARLSGDFNPLHLDENYSKSTQFKRPIVHGMLAASLFSALIGMHLPGRYSVILSQEIRYMKPIYPGTVVRVVGEVTGKVDAIKVVIIKTTISDKKGSVLVEGISKIKVMR